MIYELRAINTKDYSDIRYRVCTVKKEKAEAFKKIPKLQFEDHDIVFTAREIPRRVRKKRIVDLEDYVKQYWIIE